LLPRATRQAGKVAPQIIDKNPLKVIRSRTQRPDSVVVRSNSFGRRFFAGLDPRCPSKLVRLRRRVEYVDRGKTDVLVVLFQAAGAQAAGFFPSASVRGVGGQFTQKHQLTFADDPLGVVGVRANDTAGPTLV